MAEPKLYPGQSAYGRVEETAPPKSPPVVREKTRGDYQSDYLHAIATNPELRSKYVPGSIGPKQPFNPSKEMLMLIRHGYDNRMSPEDFTTYAKSAGAQSLPEGKRTDLGKALRGPKTRGPKTRGG